jgi:hypothetical protein
MATQRSAKRIRRDKVWMHVFLAAVISAVRYVL